MQQERVRRSALGREITACRERRGWLQADLAKRLNVGQQTVSRWEKGASRPTEVLLIAVASTLDDRTLEEWRNLAGYALPAATPVAAPLLPALPLASLSADRFEDFCRDFIAALHPRATITRLGGQGDTQYGIDIEAVFPDQRRHGYQCKRHQTFGPDKVRSVIKKLKIGVEQAVILLSRPATAAARLALGKSRKWSLWDSGDISRMIRHELSKDQASILVDTYFPGLRGGFLGISDPSPFLTRERFFAPFLRQGVFSHAWTLVGREEVVAQICGVLQKDSRAVAVVHGIGGVGKSRTILSVCEKFQKDNPGIAVRIVDAKTNVSPKDFELLRGQDTLLVVDDAHDRSDLRILFELVARSESPVRLLIVTRPFVLDLIRADLARLGTLSEEQTIGLKRLKREDAEALSHEILSKLGGSTSIASQIVAATADSPLATVVGSYLMATKRVHPSVLANERTFREQLYRSFEQAITGDLGRPDESELVRDVLGLFSLVQPADIDHPDFRALAARVINKPIDKILSVIARLHEGGVLLKRGRRLRITPDLLAEYVIQERCISLNGTSSGYAERVASEISADLLHNLIVNLSRLDWRVSQGSSESGAVLEPLWNWLLEQFREHPAARDAITKGISEAAYYQPKRALEFADIVIGGLQGPSEEIPQLLKRVAYNYTYLNEACSRLWALGKDDTRALNRFPYHPIRVLSELAAVEPDKPIVYCEGVLDFALGALKDSANFGHVHSIFEVVEAVLAADGHQTTSRGYTMTFTPFAVRLAAVRALRQKAITAILSSVAESKTAVATRAAHALHAALRYPGRGRATDYAEWTGEFVETIGKVEELFSKHDLDPVVIVALRKSFAWHVSYADGATKQAARKALDAIQKTPLYRITLNLLDGWGELRERGSEDYDATQKRMEAEAKATVEEMYATYKNADAVRTVLEERFSTITALGMAHNNSAHFLSMLVGEHADVGKAIWKAAFAKGAGYPLLAILDNVLAVLIDKEPNFALSIAREALASEIPELARAVAFAYGWRRRGGAPYSRDEIRLIGDLVRHKDETVVIGVVRALENVVSAERGLGVSLFLELDFQKSLRLVHESFMILMHNQTFRGAIKDEGVFNAILAKLALVPGIDDHWITAFIREGSKGFPHETLSFLLARIEHEQAMRDGESREFQAIPWFWNRDADLKFREHAQFPAILSAIVEWMKGKKDWIVEKRGAVLFATISGGFDDVTLQALSPSLFSPDPATVRAASSLLTEAPRTFVFEHVPLVVRLLSHAHALGKEVQGNVGSDLWGSAIQGTRSGVPGQPFPEDLAMRDKSEEILKTLSKGSPAWEFYAGLKKQAETFINMEQRRELDEFAEDEE